MNSTVLVATWSDGLLVVTGNNCERERAGQSIGSLAHDGRGEVLAIVNRHSLCRRSNDGKWATVVTCDYELSCSVAVGDVIYVGTDDARVLRVNARNEVEQLSGFDNVAGRDTWYAGSAIIDGKVVGPPLGVRSITATADGNVLLANVHVGGIPRSIDGGVTWHPTIEIDSDVHEIRAHPSDPQLVIAAAAIGLCISRDGGATWTVESEGLHASYCSAVAFSGNDILVSASDDHFSTRSAVYRRPTEGNAALQTAAAGLPTWLEGIVDTGCIATLGSALAVIDRAGNLYVSSDAGQSWTHRIDSLPSPSSVLIV